MAQQYDDYLVGGAALRRVMEEVHTDQVRQDAATSAVADSVPTALDVVELSEMWNNIH